jgi:hypothetical protein
MKAKDKSKAARIVARTLSILVFAFMCVVSVVAFATDEHLTIVDYFLIFSAPFVMGALAYFVGLYHDPAASE